MRTVGIVVLAIAGLAALSAAAQPSVSFRDCADCPEMIGIPAGRFTMGAAPGEEDREQLADAFRNRSVPSREVRIRRFAAGKFEVTRGQYRQFAEATNHDGSGCFVWNGKDFELDKTKSWRDAGYAQTDAHPAVCVSWDDASAYARWLSAKTGKKYRLLTEAEWEYATRAGSTTARYWGGNGGNNASTQCDYANGADLAATRQLPAARQWASAACDDGHAHTASAGSFRANAFGLHDMLGNVGEWTQDCWNADYRGAPFDGSPRIDGDCMMRAVRGGAWDDGPTGLRAAYRVGSPTAVRLYSRGFRVARDE